MPTQNPFADFPRYHNIGKYKKGRGWFRPPGRRSKFIPRALQGRVSKPPNGVCWTCGAPVRAPKPPGSASAYRRWKQRNTLAFWWLDCGGQPTHSNRSISGDYFGLVCTRDVSHDVRDAG